MYLSSVNDTLTGSYNRVHFIKSSEAYLEEIKAGGGKLSLALIDVDHFSQLNDRYGETAGDKALIEMVAVCDQILSEAFPELKERGIGVSRLGGEEFAFLLPTMDSALAVSFLETIREQVAGAGFSHNGEMLSITISIGVAVLGGAEDIDDLLAHADSALYQAKEQGRNKVVLYRSGFALPPVGRRVTRSRDR